MGIYSQKLEGQKSKYSMNKPLFIAFAFVSAAFAACPDSKMLGSVQCLDGETCDISEDGGYGCCNPRGETVEDDYSNETHGIPLEHHYGLLKCPKKMIMCKDCDIVGDHWRTVARQGPRTALK